MEEMWFMAPMPVFLVMAIGSYGFARTAGIASRLARLGIIAMSALWLGGLAAILLSEWAISRG
jgi:hypothetical protein